MSQRMTRSRKRQIDEENFEKFGICVDEFGCIADDYGQNSLKNAAKKHDDEDPWDGNCVVEVKRQKRDESPESNPVYFRKVRTTVTVHRQDLVKSPSPAAVKDEVPSTSATELTLHDQDEEKIEQDLLENAENEEKSKDLLLETEDNDDTASDTTDKVAEDLKVLLEETKEDEISTDLVPNGHPESPTTNEIHENAMPKLDAVRKPHVDFDKIDLLSSEVILECVDA